MEEGDIMSDLYKEDYQWITSMAFSHASEEIRERIKREKARGAHFINVFKAVNQKTRKHYEINLIPAENRMTLFIFNKDTDKVYKYINCVNKKWHSK